MVSEDQAKAQSARLAAFAEVSERLAVTASRLERARLVREYLATLSPEEAELASRWLLGRPFAEAHGRRLSVSGRAIWQALLSLDPALEVGSWAEAADLGELVRRNFVPREVAEPLTLCDVQRAFAEIAAAGGPGSRGARVRVLAGLFRRATPLEAKYISKIVIGEMRHGVQEGIVLDSLADLAALSGAEIRRVHQVVGDIGEVARAARAGETGLLVGQKVELFRPLKPMLAQSAPDVRAALAEIGGSAGFEWKLDGARVQIHKQGREVRLFSRRLKELSASLPEIVAQVGSEARAESAVFEGEVIAVAGGQPLAFQELMRRLRRIREVDETAARVEIRLYLFDLLHAGGRALIDRPAAERWERLQEARGALPAVARIVTGDPVKAGAFFDAAVAAGHEGLMAKALDAPYTPGVRGKGWLKIKKIVTLDLVVVAADWGYGRRHGWLSNYHLAVRDEQSAAFVPVGKTFKGLTDAQFRTMTERLLALKLDESHGTVRVRPEVVVEVRFTDVQKSPQYECGMALRFARIARLRDDKSPEEADTLATLRRIYEQQQARNL